MNGDTSRRSSKDFDRIIYPSKVEKKGRLGEQLRWFNNFLRSTFGCSAQDKQELLRFVVIFAAAVSMLSNGVLETPLNLPLGSAGDEKLKNVFQDRPVWMNVLMVFAPI